MTEMLRVVNVAVPAFDLLYLAVNTLDPAVRPVSKVTRLAPIASPTVAATGEMVTPYRSAAATVVAPETANAMTANSLAGVL
jgi:hypothetical protein